jgi:hypothetical protein
MGAAVNIFGRAGWPSGIQSADGRQLAAGRTIDDVLGDHSYLDRQDGLAAFAFATESIQRDPP